MNKWNKVKKEIQRRGEYIYMKRKAQEQENRKKESNKEQSKKEKQRNKDETKFAKRTKERLQLIKNSKINSENLNIDGKKVRMKKKKNRKISKENAS